jgi:hypothetical protein
MKATLQKDELLLHKKHLKILGLKKRGVGGSEVTLTVAEKFVVTGPGFSETLECKAIKWGTAKVPYYLWALLVEKLVPASRLKEITISVGHGEFHYGEMKIMNPAVCVSGPDRTSVEVPADATPLSIVLYAMRGDVDVRSKSVLEKRVQQALTSARWEIGYALSLLGKYGVTQEDLVALVAKKSGVKNVEELYAVLFGPRRW